jgi:hypothetical protein
MFRLFDPPASGRLKVDGLGGTDASGGLRVVLVSPQAAELIGLFSAVPWRSDEFPAQ